MSRMMARETTTPAPADMPWITRQKISWPIEPAAAQPPEATAKIAMPTSTTGRRPKLSESAPWKRFNTAKPSR